MTEPYIVSFNYSIQLHVVCLQNIKWPDNKNKTFFFPCFFCFIQKYRKMERNALINNEIAIIHLFNDYFRCKGENLLSLNGCPNTCHWIYKSPLTLDVWRTWKLPLFPEGIEIWDAILNRTEKKSPEMRFISDYKKAETSLKIKYMDFTN